MVSRANLVGVVLESKALGSHKILPMEAKIRSDSGQLLSFHEKCKPEFYEILKSFNILFYGYGCKNALLTRMFPEGRKFNMKFSSTRTIVEDLLIDEQHQNKNATLGDIDKSLSERNETLLLILLNFRPESREFRHLQAIRLIATMEDVDFRFDLGDLVDFNFILRDLTTFENYADETIDIDIVSDRVSSVLMVLNNLSSKSRLVFRELLRLGDCTTTEIFDSVKKLLLLTRHSSVVDLLHEFVDHKIIRLHENRIEIKLSKDDRKKVLDSSIMNRVN